MNEALEFVERLFATPLPTVLVVGGLFFLLLSVVARLGAIITVNPRRQTASALLGLVLLAAGIALHLLSPEEIPRPSPGPEAQQVSLTRDFLTSRGWTFLHGEGDVIASDVSLDPSGRINGIGHPNESRWGIEDGTLVFFHEDGRPSTRFTEVFREAGKVVLRGRLLLTEGDEEVVHVLKEQ